MRDPQPQTPFPEAPKDASPVLRPERSVRPETHHSGPTAERTETRRSPSQRPAPAAQTPAAAGGQRAAATPAHHRAPGVSPPVPRLLPRHLSVHHLLHPQLHRQHHQLQRPPAALLPALRLCRDRRGCRRWW